MRGGRILGHGLGFPSRNAGIAPGAHSTGKNAYTNQVPKIEGPTADMKRRVVVTGIGAVSPNGIGREAFWRATREGVSGVRRISRFDPSGYAVQVAGEVPDFDEDRYVSAKDRQHVSRAVPMGIAAVEEALADAGIEHERMKKDELRGVGVIVGSGGGSQEFTEEQYRLYYTGKVKQCSVYTIPTSTIGTLASEVSMRFGFRGLSHIVSTGCTSSTDAIGYAYRNIQAGVLDTMVTGGVDAPIAPLILRGFMLMRIMTSSWNSEPQRASRPFSRDRDGFVLAEGAWFVVLEELDHALARGAHIYGEIAGYASTCEAYHRVRLEECGEEPARTIQMAIDEAGIAPEAVSYINYHGTSTELNDKIETRATKLAFNGHAYKLAGSSLKSLIGHPQGACGAASIVSTLLAMRDGVVPPTINVDEPDPECDLDYVPATSRKMDFEYAVSNCIAFGSKNSAMVLRKIHAV
jgi:3-oxoacyl-[acyl-carrier-protein] synthase II